MLRKGKKINNRGIVWRRNKLIKSCIETDDKDNDYEIGYVGMKSSRVVLYQEVRKF
jgi:hypothetical protein